MRCAIRAAGLAVALLPTPGLWAQASEADQFLQDVTPEDVARFIDPTVMRSSLDYSFAANHLLLGSRLNTHRLEAFYAANSWSGAWVGLPLHTLSSPSRPTTTGVGDVLVGWGGIVHENLERRFTTALLTLEAMAPSGDPENGPGVGTWVLAPGGSLAVNPTNSFPVYFSARYLHSLEGLRGGAASAGGEDEPDRRIRLAELTLQTVHVVSGGLFISVVPNLIVDVHRNRSVFTLGIGAGVALNPWLAISGSYTRRLSGRSDFEQVFGVQASVLFGERKDKQ